MDNEIKLFEGNQIRSVWDNEKEEWYFSVIDILYLTFLKIMIILYVKLACHLKKVV